ncbi:hypothetical protein [Adhaeribacter aerolatus]|nr:hypothetical protein [Adhaeribacter aerolatus]
MSEYLARQRQINGTFVVLPKGQLDDSRAFRLVVTATSLAVVG